MGKIICLLGVWLALLPSSAGWAQVPLLAFLKPQPAAQHAANTKAPWVVYSDRDNNSTYRQASLATRFQKAQFREAFYVLAERKGFLKLVRYDPALKVGTFYARRLLKDRKAAQYAGWAPKSHFLLASQAPADSLGTTPALYCPALVNAAVLSNLNNYLSHDSLRLFAGPNLASPLTTRLKLYDLAYLYKLSDSGTEALVGKTDWFAADSAATTLLGWAPVAALQRLGQGWFVEADSAAAGRAAQPSVASPTTALLNKPDSLGFSFAFPMVSWSGASRFPVLKKTQVNSSRPTLWQLGLLTPLLASDNYVLNANGQRITQQQMMNWQAHSLSYNLLYVVEDSRAMRPFWGELVNTAQATISRLQSQNQGAAIRLGAVLYHRMPTATPAAARVNHITTQPLTRDLGRAVDRLSRLKLDSVARVASTSQPIRAGLEQAFKMFADYPGENNVVVLVGINGDASNVAQTRAIRTGMQRSEARLLSFQVSAPADTLANSFVLQSQQLVFQSALEEGKAKRDRLVNPGQVVPKPVYDLQLGAQNVYRLAFPKQSMIPGWVLFPTKNKTLPISLLQSTTDSLLAQMRFDTRQTQAALERTFAAMLPLRSRFSPQVSRAFVARKEALMPTLTPAAFGLRTYPFFDRVYTGSFGSTTGFRQLRLITLDTYDVLGQWLTLLAADDLTPTRSAARRQLLGRFRQLGKHTGSALSDTVRLSFPISQLLGLPVRHPLLNQLRMADLNQPSRLPQETFLQLLALLRERRDWYQRVPTTPHGRLTSNGNTYYWLREDLFR
ncbi:type VI secretion system protein TssR domain-containing protein [Hymenobacter sp. GOD-10R]|uniref:type VI secretion system protein TssR domain-containing protein n=1 Tax=Hymenobacter sp. GOD-10R TaxID=3093922 RepID=UPI002D776D3D|nr:type VI secretion system protein TssR domain-containing protein [Hymenobacter sp. GOD-10R]WRQ31276.1 type VI secretion system protein TssR domain-containing protein [Hymenobacter sp. GOD-10R]